MFICNVVVFSYIFNCFGSKVSLEHYIGKDKLRKKIINPVIMNMRIHQTKNVNYKNTKFWPNRAGSPVRPNQEGA